MTRPNTSCIVNNKSHNYVSKISKGRFIQAKLRIEMPFPLRRHTPLLCSLPSATRARKPRTPPPLQAARSGTRIRA